MIWFLFAILGAFFNATYFMLVKRMLKGVDQYLLASGAFLCGGVILFIVSWFNGFPELGDFFLQSVFSTSMINVVAIVLVYKALKNNDLSLTVPMISFTPVFLIITSNVMLGEFPSQQGILGIGLIVAGSYVLNSNQEQKEFLEPLREVFRNRGSSYMLIVAFLYSLSANFDKMVVMNSDIFFGTSMVCLIIGLFFLGITLSRGYAGTNDYARNLPGFLLVGFTIALIAISVNTALSMQIVPYVISVKRLSILFSVAYGFIVFKEKEIMRKGFGAAMMTFGAIAIFFSQV